MLRSLTLQIELAMLQTYEPWSAAPPCRGGAGRGSPPLIVMYIFSITPTHSGAGRELRLWYCCHLPQVLTNFYPHP